MRLVRFMGTEEMDGYIAGLTLVNHTNWMIDQHKATHSEGFCFFDDSVAPEKRMEYLTGIVELCGKQENPYSDGDDRCECKNTGPAEMPTREMCSECKYKWLASEVDE